MAYPRAANLSLADTHQGRPSLDGEGLAATQMTFLSLSPTFEGQKLWRAAVIPATDESARKCWTQPHHHLNSSKMSLSKCTDSITRRSSEDEENGAARALYQT